MPRSYRHILIAAVAGLILTAAAPTTNPHKLIAYREICRTPKDDAQAGVCASIAQASAAQTANELSREALKWNIAGIVAVTLTLIATSIASWAAIAAVRHSRRIGEAQTRAYLANPIAPSPVLFRGHSLSSHGAEQWPVASSFRSDYAGDYR